MKAYWPYLPVALMVGLAMVANTVWLKPGVLSYATNMTSTGLLSGTNTERAKNGLGTLALNASLSKAAQAKAQDMVNRDYWSHNTPDGQEPWVFINNTGYKYLAAGENLAYGFTTHGQTIVGWMNSAGHRANILNGEYREVGFGIVNSANYQNNGEQTIVVAMYAKPAPVVASNPAPNPTPAPAPAPSPTPETSKPDEKSDEDIDPIEDTQPIAVATPSERSQEEGIAVSATVPGPEKVARVQIATSGTAPWSLFAASSLAVILAVFFITRHSIAWHRAVVRGEKFFLKHKLLDVILVGAILLAAIMSQTVGFIQ